MANEAWPHGAPKVGDVAQRSRTIGPNDIELFTDISGDRNPLHYDVEGVKSTKFGEIVVQGGITSAILNAVVAEDLPGPGSVFMNVNWSFKAPTRPGDTITGRVEVTEARADKPITKLRTTVTRQDGVVVLEGDAVVYTFPMARTQGSTAGDRAAIEGIARDYFEGWFTGDVERMNRALHTDLVKRSPNFAPAPGQLRLTTKERMMEMTANAQGKEDVGDGRLEIRIEDIHDDIASVTVRGGLYREYLHLVKTEEGWKIANTFWNLEK